MQAASSPMMCTCGLRMVVWMGLLFLESTERKGRLWNLTSAWNNFICLLSTYSCRNKIDGSPFPPPDYPAPPARMRSSRDHRSCCEHTQEGQNVKSARKCHYLQDLTSLSISHLHEEEKATTEYYTTTLFANCCRVMIVKETHDFA